MQKIINEWKEKERKEWHGDVKFLKNGLEIEEGEVLWDDSMYNQLKENFCDSSFLYCYQVKRKETIYYIDFSVDEYECRFWFYEQKNIIKWNVCIKNVEKTRYETKFERMKEKSLFTLHKKASFLYDMVQKHPNYRIKIVTGKLTLKEKSEAVFFEYVDEYFMKKEG